MLCDYAHEELKIPLAQGRVVVSNEHWLAIVPWWATWPFETMGTSVVTLYTPGLIDSHFPSSSLSPSCRGNIQPYQRGESGFCGHCVLPY